MKHNQLRERKSEFRRYIDIRLGKCAESEQIGRMFAKSFRAKNYREFWWYWNPTYGFLLSKYIYKPLRRVLPRDISVILTFAACGLFLHDLPVVGLVLLLKGFLLPFPITIFFTILGLINVISTKLKLSFDRLNSYMRILIHSVTLAGSFMATLRIVKIIVGWYH